MSKLKVLLEEWDQQPSSKVSFGSCLFEVFHHKKTHGSGVSRMEQRNGETGQEVGEGDWEREGGLGKGRGGVSLISGKAKVVGVLEGVLVGWMLGGTCSPGGLNLWRKSSMLRAVSICPLPPWLEIFYFLSCILNNALVVSHLRQARNSLQQPCELTAYCTESTNTVYTWPDKDNYLYSHELVPPPPPQKYICIILPWTRKKLSTCFDELKTLCKSKQNNKNKDSHGICNRSPFSPRGIKKESWRT